MSQHPSDYALYKHLAGELDAHAETRLKDHLDACIHCRQRLDALRSERAEFQIRHSVPDDLPGPVSVKTRAVSLWWTRPAFAWGSVALIFLAGALLWWAFDRSPGEVPNDDVRYKGTSLRWVVERNGIQHDAGPDFLFRSGDRIGWTLQADKDMFVAVIGLNSSGAGRILVPNPNDQPAIWIKSSPSQPATLPFSLRITEPLEQERIIVLLSPGKIDIHDVLRAVNSTVSDPADTDGLNRVAAELPTVRVDSRLIGHPQ